MRHVECSAIGLADLTDWTQFNWTCAAIKADLERDAGAAAAMAKAASGFIADPTPDQLAAFAEVFGSRPESRVPGTRLIIGRVVKARFDGVFKLLDSGGLLYSLGLPKRAGGPEPGDRLGYQFKAKAGQLWIALGRGHFTELFRDQRASNVLAATLLAAYGEWVKRTSAAPPLNNVFCYLKFVYRAWGGSEAPLWVLDHCSVST
ncbi:MAG: hypothetical protein ACREXX_03730 [Gammaproteobacteria bacterium]